MEDALLDTFLRGHADAVAEVCRIVARTVASHGYYIPQQDRQQVIQTALQDICAMVSRRGFTLRSDSRALVRRIAHRRCVDWMRDQRRRREIDCEVVGLRAWAMSGVAGPDEVALRREKGELILRVVRAMAPSHRELIRLRVVEELGYAEIARMQGRSEEAVRQQWCACLRAAGRIRRELEQAAESPKGGRR